MTTGAVENMGVKLGSDDMTGLSGVVVYPALAHAQLVQNLCSAWQVLCTVQLQIGLGDFEYLRLCQEVYHLQTALRLHPLGGPPDKTDGISLYGARSCM